MISGSLPRRYARALIEIAEEEDQVATFGERLQSWQQEIQKKPEILEGLANNQFDLKERLAAMEEILEKGDDPLLLKNFFKLLLEKGRIGLLHEIVREYQVIQDEILGILRVGVRTAEKPEPADLKRIEKILGQKLGQKVIARGNLDPTLIGGMVLEANHTIYDGSIRRDLERIREMMES